MNDLSKQVWARLRCVDCSRPLEQVADGAQCTGCGSRYRYNEHGSLDLRPRRARVVSLDFTVGNPAPTELSFVSEPLSTSRTPQVDFSGLKVPRHLTRELLSHFPNAQSSGSLALDLGCGEAVHMEVCRRAGYEWVGMDFSASKAPILGDAQMIPFADDTFAFALCVTVLQYVQNPFVAMREIFRVLKPNGVLIGSVAFLEPSHGTSFFHHSHVGTYSLLTGAGFNISKIAPFADWPALKALASMGLFSRMPRWIAQAVVAPLQLLHVAWWRLGGLLSRENLEKDRLNHFSGSFSFIASKPG